MKKKVPGLLLSGTESFPSKKKEPSHLQLQWSPVVRNSEQAEVGQQKEEVARERKFPRVPVYIRPLLVM